MNRSLVEREVVLSNIHFKEGPMTPQSTHIEKIIALLESGEITILVAPLYPGYDGWYYTDEKISLIRRHLSPERGAEALIHSCLHALYPGAPHDWIEQREEEVRATLTDADRKKLGTFLQRRRR